MKSGIYEGSVFHRRHQPMTHDFLYKLFMMYLDLDELPTVFDGSWLFGSRGMAPVKFRRKDFLGPHDLPLDVAVRELVNQRLGFRPLGPIRMLTHLSFFGYCFNPVTFYYCFANNSQRVEAFIAEINNTPWDERFAYVLKPGASGENTFEMAKIFHVSPFFPMDMDYTWRVGVPGEDLSIVMENRREDELCFEVGLNLERQPVTAANLRRIFRRYPLMTLKVTAGIYWQAFRLKRKGVPYFHHPKNDPLKELQHENARRIDQPHTFPDSGSAGQSGSKSGLQATGAIALRPHDLAEKRS